MHEIKIAIIKNGVTPSHTKFEGDNYGPVGWCNRVCLGLPDTNDEKVGSLTACVFKRPEEPKFDQYVHGYNGSNGKASEWLIIGMTMDELHKLREGFDGHNTEAGLDFHFTWDDTFKETNDDSLVAIEKLLQNNDGKIGE